MGCQVIGYLGRILDFYYRVKIRSNKCVIISKKAKIHRYRNFSVADGSTLNIGGQSIIEASIILNNNSNVVVGKRTFIGGSVVTSAKEVIIGDDVLISWGCIIMDHDGHSISWEKRSSDVLNWAAGSKKWEDVNSSPVKIHNKAWIGANSIILKGVEIGEGAIIAAGSVVTNNLDSWSVYGGNPAKLIRRMVNEPQ